MVGAAILSRATFPGGVKPMPERLERSLVVTSRATPSGDAASPPGGRSHSWRIASIGDSRAARNAGNVPNASPIVTAEMTDVAIVLGVIAA